MLTFLKPQVEKQRRKDELDLIKTEEQIRDIRIATDQREAMER